MADRATHHRWDDLEIEELNPLLGPRDVREWWSRVDLSRDSWVFEEDDDQSL